MCRSFDGGPYSNHRYPLGCARDVPLHIRSLSSSCLPRPVWLTCQKPWVHSRPEVGTVPHYPSLHQWTCCSKIKNVPLYLPDDRVEALNILPPGTCSGTSHVAFCHRNGDLITDR